MDDIARKRWELIADETIDRAMKAGLAPLLRDPEACRELGLDGNLPEDLANALQDLTSD